MERPGVWTWYVVYALFLSLLYLGLVGLGIVFLTVDLDDPNTGPAEQLMMALIFIGLGAPLAIVTGIAPLLPRRPWAWIYHLVLICLGLSGCTIVFAVPLLVFWLKPETKAWFYRE